MRLACRSQQPSRRRLPNPSAWASSGVLTSAPPQPLDVAGPQRDRAAPGRAAGRVGEADEPLAPFGLEQLDDRGEPLVAGPLRKREPLDEGRRAPGSCCPCHGRDGRDKDVAHGIRLCHESVKAQPRDVSEARSRSMLTCMTRFLALAFSALAAAAFAGLATVPRAAASSGVRYGLTDDAWLLDGPGTLEARLAQLDTLGVRVVRFTLRWDQVAATEPTSPTDPSDPAYDWTADDAVLHGLHAHGVDVVVQLLGTPAWANGGRHIELRPDLGHGVPRLRDGRCHPVRVGGEVADLERAEPGALVAPDEPRDLHLASPQSSLCGDSRSDPERASCRRRNGAARLDGRRLTGRVAHRNAQGAREARRLRAQPLPTRPEARVAASAAAARTARRSRWRRSGSSCSSSRATSRGRVSG